MAKREESQYDPNADLTALEEKIEECRVRYEMYFNGQLKREPIWYRNEINKIVMRLRRANLKKVAHRFRFNSLASKLGVLRRYWDRINNEREKGTYHKDVVKARRNELLRRGASLSDAVHQTMARPSSQDEDKESRPGVYSLEDPGQIDTEAELRKEMAAAERQVTAAERRAVSPPTASAQEPTQKAPSSQGPGEEEMQKIYRTYLAAKRKCKEDVDGLSYQAVSDSIRRQVPVLEKKGYQDVDFKVFIRSGKAVLKAVPRSPKDEAKP